MVSLDKKVFIIGLDGVPYNLFFEEWIDDLKNLKKLKEESEYGILESIIPPITVPAWLSMITGKTPGELGIYGFRNRKSYEDYALSITTSYDVKEDTIFEEISKIGYKVIAFAVPPSYPPKPLNGIRISCFLTPDSQSQYAYPEEIKREIEEKFGEYLFDVRKFRTENKEWLLKEIYKMTEQRFEIVKYLIKNKEWNLFFFVEMGPDRIHHGFWKFFDKNHPKYEKGNKYENEVKKYYIYLDEKIGEVMNLLPDNSYILILSDHGAKGMEGGIAINEWLIKNGFLRLKDYPDEIKRLEIQNIDFSKTIAWGEGGYYGRIFLNVKGREKEGVIDKKDYERIRRELKEEIENIPDEKGNKIKTSAYFPEEIYPEIKGTPPDLIVLFGDLKWRSIGSIGLKDIYTFENDTGPDDANHSMEGIYLIKYPDLKEKGKKDLKIYDIYKILRNIFYAPGGT